MKIMTTLFLLLTMGTALANQALFDNSDFEKGDLSNWTVEGKAFKNQPTKGDNPKARNRSSKHQGTFWIGTYENYSGKKGKPGATQGDRPQGSITSTEFTISKNFINFRIGAGHHPGKTGVKLLVDGGEVSLATGVDSESMVLVSINVSKYKGKTARLVVFDKASGDWGHINADDFTGSDKALGQDPRKLLQSDVIIVEDYSEMNYNQKHRPLFHFTSKKNWLNDPNGLVYYDGEYHMYFQHNPLATSHGHMTWGHAVSQDMIHWKQLKHALLPYEGGTIYSGTGFVDHSNTLKKQSGVTKTLVNVFTFARKPFYQAMAFSTDKGRNWEYLNEGKAVVPNQGLDDGERDPKIFWHEDTQKWVMVLWVSRNPGTVRFFTSTDLINWQKVNDLQRDWAYECMDMVQLAVDGDQKNRKWLIYDASFDYEIGSFDGKVFTTEGVTGRGDLGRNYYAAQSFSNSPDGRIVQIGWMRGSNFAKAGMPFNQQMSIPTVMTLRTTEEGIKLFRWPIKEIESLYFATHKVDAQVMKPGHNPLAKIKAETFDLELLFKPGSCKTVDLKMRGTELVYHVVEQRLDGPGFTLPLKPVAGVAELRILMDRGSIEIFSNEGEYVSTNYVLPDPENKDLSLTVRDGELSIDSLVINELGSSWE